MSEPEKCVSNVVEDVISPNEAKEESGDCLPRPSATPLVRATPPATPSFLKKTSFYPKLKKKSASKPAKSEKKVKEDSNLVKYVIKHLL